MGSGEGRSKNENFNTARPDRLFPVTHALCSPVSLYLGRIYLVRSPPPRDMTIRTTCSISLFLMVKERWEIYRLFHISPCDIDTQQAKGPGVAGGQGGGHTIPRTRQDGIWMAGCLLAFVKKISHPECIHTHYIRIRILLWAFSSPRSRQQRKAFSVSCIRTSQLTYVNKARMTGQSAVKGAGLLHLLALCIARLFPVWKFQQLGEM